MPNCPNRVLRQKVCFYIYELILLLVPNFMCNTNSLAGVEVQLMSFQKNTSKNYYSS